MNTSFTHALAVQGRVLWALTLREVQTVHGHTSIGYLWEIFKLVFGIMLLWAIRMFMGFHSPTGMHVLLFLVLGFIPMNLFTLTVNRGLRAASGNFSLLTFPQITPLDLHLSSSLVAFVTEITIMGLFFCGILVAKIECVLVNPVLFGFGLLGLAFFSAGFSMTLASLNYYLPLIKELLPMLMRVLFFTSGVFFSPANMARVMGDWIMWNPLASYIELLRGSFLHFEPSDAVKMDYLVSVTVCFFCIGLLLERYTRRKVGTE